MKSKIVVIASACILMGACVSPAPTSVLTLREFQGVGWCAGLAEAAGRDPSGFRDIMRRERLAHATLYTSRDAEADQRDARRAMKRATGARRTRLVSRLDRECQALQHVAGTRTHAPRSSARYGETGRMTGQGAGRRPGP